MNETSRPDYDVAIEYFRAVRAEIELRIKNQSYYTISKIVACGGLLGHLGTNQPGLAVFAVPLIAVFLDFVIHHNLAIINSLGRYVRDELEEKVFSSTVATKNLVLWETYGGQTTNSRLADILDRFGQISITVAFLIAAVLLYSDKGASTNEAVVAMLGVVLLLAMDIFFAVKIRAAAGATPNRVV